jgi:hypothetical protein
MTAGTSVAPPDTRPANEPRTGGLAFYDVRSPCIVTDVLGSTLRIRLAVECRARRSHILAIAGVSRQRYSPLLSAYTSNFQAIAHSLSSALFPNTADARADRSTRGQRSCGRSISASPPRSAPFQAARTVRPVGPPRSVPPNGVRACIETATTERQTLTNEAFEKVGWYTRFNK